MSKKLLLGSVMSLALMSAAGVATAQEVEDETSVQQTVIITGTRRDARSAQDSVAPVDVVSGAELTNQGDSDLSNLIRTSVPSYNVNTQPISDAATLIRPANLRGLSPDNTLVLVNGKRQHRAAVIAFLGGGISDGAQGPDISTIPAIALKQVEVLRDGAASQYGSDAIAGVINFILKDSAEGGQVEGRWGQTYDGDGTNYTIAGNIGLPLGEQGFVNLSAEFSEKDPTDRSVQRDDALALIAAGNTDVRQPFAQIWGEPEISGDIKLYANTGFEVSDFLELYAFGNYAQREAEGGFFFRNPENRGGVFSNDGGETLLIGDLTADGSGACPTGAPNDPDLLAALAADPDCFAFTELFPGGFTPQFGGELQDLSAAVGARGELAIGTGLAYDVSYRFGQNDIDFFINNTINASLGPNTPTEFNPGGYTQTDNLVNVDFAYGLPIEAFASDLNVAFGYEFRNEEFDITAGDQASFEIGQLAAPSDAFPLGQGFASSSNGFGGFTTNSAGANDQTNHSVYVDLEADVIDAITLQAAVRYEDYDVFGSDTNFKVGGLFRVNDNLRLRTTYSTGFKVPTAGQANVVNVTTAFTGGVLADQGTFPLNSAAGAVVADFIEARDGVRPTLTPEESENFTIGASFNLGDFDFTVDYFNISLDDRISISSQQPFGEALEALAASNNVALADGLTTSQIINTLDGAGVINAADFAGSEDLTAFAFFNNAFDTNTQGIDFVASGPLNFIPWGDTDLNVVLNFTETEVKRADNTITEGRIRQLEENIPEWRWNATLTHEQGPISGLVRMNYFGEFFEDHLDSNLAFPIEGDEDITFDAELGYEVVEGLQIAVGGTNIFDNNPTENPFAGVVGAQFPVTAPNGFRGGSYYIRARYNW